MHLWEVEAQFYPMHMGKKYNSWDHMINQISNDYTGILDGEKIIDFCWYHVRI